MSNYYGVIRSKDYLAHYGVKGMKWGVRKALDSKNPDKKLERQYAKASKKLQKLSERADIETQKGVANTQNAKALDAFMVGSGVSLLSGMTSRHRNDTGFDIARAAISLPGIIIRSGFHKAKASRAKKRTTAEGHAKAIAERDAWQKEMRSTFKGTKYDTSKKKRR